MDRSSYASSSPYRVERKILIDSRSRDHSTYPSPNHYSVILDTEIRDIRSVHLAGAILPNAAFTLPGHRNSDFGIVVGTHPPKTLALQSGDYMSGAALAIALNSQLGSHSITASFRGVDSRIVFSSPDAAFGIWFGNESSCPARLIGFESDSILSATFDTDANVWLLEAPFRIDLLAFRRFIVVEMWQPSAEVLVSPNANVNTAFAVIEYPTNTSTSEHCGSLSSGIRTIMGTPKTWDPPLSSIRRIGITLKNDDGSLVDFQNQDHVLEIIAESSTITSRFT